MSPGPELAAAVEAPKGLALLCRPWDNAVMKRDMNLVRQILLDVEEHGGTHPKATVKLDIPDYSPDVVSHHVKLLKDAGYLTALDHSSNDGSSWIPKALTWSGHEFLDAARNAGIWNKALDMAKQTVGTVSFDLLKALLLKLGAERLGLSLAMLTLAQGMPGV